MRILHFSDAHVGMENYGRVDPATGLNTRLKDFTDALDKVVEAAVQESVDLVLFTGDAYRSRDPNPTHQREFARRIFQLTKANIPVFLLVGNHDLPLSRGRANSVDIFETLDVQGIQVGRRPELVTMNTRSGPLQIAALPWVPVGFLMGMEDHRGKTPDELRAALQETIADQIERLAQQVNPEFPAVLAAHVSVLGAAYSSERSVTLGQDPVIPVSVLANPAFSYVGLGHIHKHQVMRASQPPVAYAGSIERIDFGEEREPKGYLIVDIGTSETTLDFRELEGRRFVTIDVPASDQEPTEAALRAIEKHVIKGAVVRLSLHISEEQSGQVRLGEIRQALREAYYLAGVHKKVEDSRRQPIPGIRELTPEKALELYLKLKDVPKDRLEPLRERGRGIIIEAATLGKTYGE